MAVRDGGTAVRVREMAVRNGETAVMDGSSIQKLVFGWVCTVPMRQFC